MKTLRTFLLMLLPSMVQSATLLDTFDRPDAPNLGLNWAAQFGNAEVINQRAKGLDGGQALLTYAGYSSTSISTDLFVGTGDLEYVALVLGYKDLDNNYFIKIQDQDSSGLFGYYAFYYGNNGSGLFTTLSAPFVSGNITATLSGTTVTLVVLPTNAAAQVYRHDYGVGSGGSGIGLGFFGSAQADNFVDSAPEPSTIVLICAGVAGLVISERLRKRSGSVVPTKVSHVSVGSRDSPKRPR